VISEDARPRALPIDEVLDGDSLVVVCAANNWDSMRVADQHISIQMARTSPVLYVDPPLSRLTPRRNPELRGCLDGPRVRVLAPNLVRFTPVVPPGPQRPGISPVATAIVRRRLRAVVESLGLPVQALLCAWPLRAMEGSCNEALTVFWAQDDFTGGAELFGLAGRRLARGEARRAARADLVIAANPGVADRWRAAGCAVELIPFGCDAERFAGVDDESPATDVHLQGPIAGVVGQFNARTDLALLEAVAARGCSLLLVGPVYDGLDPGRFEKLVELSNVQWVGRQPFEKVASYLRVVDVGLVPYADTAFNRGSFPLKTLEYLAAGRRVVATDLPATRWLATDLVAVASEPRAFADAVEAAISSRASADEVAERRRFAAGHSWALRALDMARAVGRAPEAAGSRAPAASAS
jgi:glycosyltransferase involved in cell wall biosynthesis